MTLLTDDDSLRATPRRDRQHYAAFAIGLDFAYALAAYMLSIMPPACRVSLSTAHAARFHRRVGAADTGAAMMRSGQ